MPVSPETMRLLLVASLLGMVLIAVLSLRRRELTAEEYFWWGLLIVLLPFLGPFLAILLKPGVPRRSHPSRVKPKSESIS